MSSTTPDAAAPAAAAEQKPMRVQVRGMSAHISLRKLINDAKAAGINARFVAGNRFARHQRHFYITAHEDIERAKEFVAEWYKDNIPPLRRRASPAAATGDAAADGAPNASSDASKDASQAASQPASPESAKPQDGASSDAPTATDVSKEQAKEDSKEPSTEASLEASKEPSKEAPEEPSTEASKESSKEPSKEPSQEPASDSAAPRRQPTKLTFVDVTNRAPFGNGLKKKKPRQGAAAGDESAADEGAESKPASGDGDGAAAGDNAGARPRTRTPKQRKPRTPTRFEPQPSKVALKLPSEATVEELRALLPDDFTSVEISLKHIHRRVIFRDRQRVNAPDYTLALIDVGEENQARAIEILRGKELKGERLDPKPGRNRVPVEQHPVESTEDRAPQVEHVESKE